jgi:chromosome segregation ATPase
MARGIPKPYSAQLTNVIVIKQEGSPTMALTATLSELYGAFRRRAGRAAQGMGIADTRFNTTDEKLDALSQRFDEHGQAFDGLKREPDQRSDALNQSMDHRFDALSRRLRWLVKQPFDELKRELDERFDARDQALEQRFDAVSGRFDGLNQAFRELGRALEQLTDALSHSVSSLDALSQRFDEHHQAVGQRFVGMEVQLARLETNVARMLERRTEVIKTPKKLRYLWWTLGILLALMLGFGAKAIFDWQTPMTFRSLWENWPGLGTD